MQEEGVSVATETPSIAPHRRVQRLKGSGVHPMQKEPARTVGRRAGSWRDFPRRTSDLDLFSKITIALMIATLAVAIATLVATIAIGVATLDQSDWEYRHPYQNLASSKIVQEAGKRFVSAEISLHDPLSPSATPGCNPADRDYVTTLATCRTSTRTPSAPITLSLDDIEPQCSRGTVMRCRPAIITKTAERLPNIKLHRHTWGAAAWAGRCRYRPREHRTRSNQAGRSHRRLVNAPG